MKVLVGYSTSEGHTRKIARHVGDRLVDIGHAVELLCLDDSGDLELERFDRIILASPIHTGHYHRAFSDFVGKRSDQLNDMPTLFLSISLAAAGHDAEDWKSLAKIAADLTEATGWAPTQTEQIAGAYKPSEYDFFKRFIMRKIISAKDPAADLDQDKIYTDWEKLDAVAERWMKAQP